jgi:hypothetical protein
VSLSSQIGIGQIDKDKEFQVNTKSSRRQASSDLVGDLQPHYEYSAAFEFSDRIFLSVNAFECLKLVESNISRVNKVASW